MIINLKNSLKTSNNSKVGGEVIFLKLCMFGMASDFFLHERCPIALAMKLPVQTNIGSLSFMCFCSVQICFLHIFVAFIISYDNNPETLD